MGFVKQPLYYIYSKMLTSEVKRRELPQHVGLILDGNRRYARKQGLEDVAKGHQKGADKLDEVLAWCDELDIKAITIWVLSTENLNRPPEEVRKLLTIIENKITDIANNPATHKKKVRIRAVGQLEMLPPSTRKVIAEAEAKTKGYGSFYLNIAIGYGGRQEIADAFKKLIREKQHAGVSLDKLAEEINPEIISKYMYAYDIPDPDLIIRTSGEVRLSGFLLWQSAYSEFYFCDVYWPSFRKIDLLRAIRNYQQRQRKFGR